MPVFALSLRVFLLPSVVILETSLFSLGFLHFSTGLNTYQSTITDGGAQVLQNSIRNIVEDIVAMEEFIHTACDKTIPNYRQSTTRKPTSLEHDQTYFLDPCP
jgi:hypothetical protein